MKKRLLYYTSIIATALGMLTFSSCKKGGFLDSSTETQLNETTTFSDSINTTQFLTRIYQDVGFLFNIQYHSAGGHSVAADEGVSGRFNGTANTAVTIEFGLVSPQSTAAQFINMWSIPYQNIRRANLFLKNIEKAPINAATKKIMIAEARFLRAWYYFLLIRSYGGVPLIGDIVYTEQDIIRDPRATYEKCVTYIVSECESAKADLPNAANILSQDYGRVTKGACMALQSRVLLYAASPLFNGGQLATSGEIRTITGYGAPDKERWKKAADAALQIIKTNEYSLFTDNITRKGYGFYKVFQMRVNEEYLFAGMRGLQREYESFLLPQSRSGGYAFTVSQQIVDRFPMKNGKAITDPGSGYNPANPYVNRDPRFANSIIYNGAPWILNGNLTAPVNTYIGSGTSEAVKGTLAFNTGYYPRKMLLENAVNNGERCWPLIRYAEILLNYAEALNEYNGPVADVFKVLKELRSRAGIDAGTNGDYGINANITQAEMRALIQNERAIELFMEEHRMWDVRRWNLGETEFVKPIVGVQITQTGTTYSYAYADVRIHAFPKHYGLFPILSGELAKNPSLIQNPGW